MSDGTLRFDTKIDMSGFKAALESAEQMAAATKSSLDSINAEKAASSVEQIAEAAEDAKDAVKEAAEAAKKANDSAEDMEGSVKDAAQSAEKLSNETDGVAGSFDEAAKSADDFKNKTATIGDIIKGTLGADVLKGAAESVIEFGKKAISLASDLDEVQNVVDVTFGEAEDKIERFAETASQQFGLTEIQVKQFSGTFGAMVKSMGLSESAAADLALDMTGLTADMASFYNLDHETAFEKLRAGLSGETEPLKALGINMSVANLEAFALAEGIETAYDRMTEAEKVQLRYNYIMDATSDSQGDFARTSDGFANQLRLLSNNIDSLAANIGAALLPAATAGLQAINSLFSGGAGGNQTLEEIKSIADAINGENGLTKQIDDIRSNYAETSITLRVNYGKANNLLDEYDALLKEYMDGGEYSGKNLRLGMDSGEIEKLQNDLRALNYEISDADGVFGESTLAAVRAFQEASSLSVDGIAGIQTQAALIAQTTGDLQDMVTQLVTLYPELAQYVGDNGLFTQEREQLQALIDQYDQYARMRAYETMLGDTANAYYGAEIQYETLAAKQQQAAEDYQSAAEKMERLQEVSGTFYTANDVLKGKDKAEAYEAIAAAINAYIDAADGLEGVNLEGINLGDITDENGLIQYIEGSEQALYDLFEQIDQFALKDQLTETQTALDDTAAAYTAAVDAAVAAVDTLESARDEYDAMYSVYEEKFGDTGETIDRAVAGGVASYSDLTVAAVDELFDSAIAEASRRAAELNGVLGGLRTGNTRTTPRKHASGLDYVPYDGYRATLHLGERVLTAAENRAYTQGGGFDAGALIDALSGLTTDRRDIVVTVDGHELARYMADENRRALSERAGRLARGRGL